MDDETQIRTSIERWAAAVHDGDLDRVLAAHADDIVMFDVPPPENGVRGIQAYQNTWPVRSTSRHGRRRLTTANTPTC
jgi:ketosteroid isomerase-like protein